MNIHQEQDILKRNAELEKELAVKNRELEVESALERVRAKTMAMQTPSEFVDVIIVIGEQFVHLGFDIEWANFGANGLDVSNGIDVWNFAVIPGLYQAAERLYIPYIDHPVFTIAAAGLEKYQRTGEDFFVIDLDKKDKDRWMDHMYTRSEFKEMPDEFKTIQYNKPGYSSSVIVLKDTWLSIGKFDPKPFTDEQNAILGRFANAFGQAYTRFLDLQKAEAQAKEARIELALERVRARAMAMHNSNELAELVSTVFNELTQLDFRLTSCIIWIHDHESTKNTLWIASAEMNKSAEPFLVSIFHNDFFKSINHAWRSKDTKWIYTFTGKEKKDFEKAFFKEIPHLPISLKNALEVPKQVVFSASFNNFGALEIVETEALTDEKFEILHRFGKVFDLSYTRFNDLKKAESQAREAQIETALERVRSRSMAMHKSDDLHEVIKVVIEQLSLLGLKFNVANFAKIDPDGSWDLWLSTPEQAYPGLIHVPYLDHPIFNHITEQVAKNKDFYTDVYTREETNIFFHHFFENTIAKNSPEERKQFVYSSKGFSRSLFLTKNIWFSVGRYDVTAFTDEENAIFKRFANVFEQAYTRFLDLQKAESQAREAEIELALERVRAKTMAMQKPSEFVGVINIIGEQFVHLGFDIDWVNFGANGFAISEGIDIWNFAVIPGASPMSARVFIPYFDHPVFTTSAATINEFLNGGRDFLTVVLDKQTKDTWLDHLFTKTVFKDVPEEYRAIQYAKPGYTTSNISLNNTWLSIGKFDTKTFTDEQHAILRRFANAFGQAYTRFLDLQKAEAQAREAQIEAGLERVRSRAMAMQSSEQLRELIGTVFTELTKLDIVLTRCLIMIYDPKSNDSVWWMANSEAPTQPIGLKVQYHEHPSYLAYVNAWKQKEIKWTYTLEGNTKKEWDDFLFVETELSHLPDFVIAGMKAPDRVYLNASFNSFGNLTLATLEPLSDEHFDIMLRFAKVFDLTYTRFNDLKQAEAQTREAQIELALERVRARTMAMHKSEELGETAQVLFHQLSELGGIPDRIAIGIADEANSVVNFWSTDQQGSHLDNSFSARLNERTTIAKTYQAWKEQKKSLVIDLHGDELNEWIQFAREEMGISVKDDQIKDRRVHSFAFFSHGWILATSHVPQSTEAIQILERFASVFNLTYRRFLDLVKAEAQAREAQIEAALERVRSSSLAMHKSDELKDVVKIVFENFRSLGLEHIDSVNINIFHQGSKDFDLWLAAPGQDYTTNFHLPYFDHPIVNDFFNDVSKGENLHKGVYGYDEKNKYFEYMFENSDNKYLPEERKKLILNGPAYSVVTAIAKHSSIFIHNYSGKTFSEEVKSILQRFTRVFEQSYTRFLDLEKAEAQAKEAQIETALEKVRSRSLAMHKSDELQEVVNTVFERLMDLDIEVDSTNIAIFKEGSKDFDYWIASNAQKRAASFHMPYVDLSLTKDIVAARESGVDFSATSYPFEIKNEWFDFAFKETDFKFLSEARKQFILNTPGITVGIAFSKHTGVQVNRYSDKLLSEGEKEILKRFSKVFEQAYIRFRDLEKAEANAREAQIEVGLERVRAKAMAMHSSKDLAETLGVFYRELKSLSVTPIRCGVALMDKETRMAELTTMNTTGEGDSIEIIGKIKMAGHPVLDGVFESWLLQKEYHAVLRGNQIKEYYQVLKPQIDYLDYSHDEAQFGYYFMFNEGDVYAWTEKELTEDELTIYRRFTTVISLTYKRYKDLQQAEAQAREAKIEAGLERVRARTMAMHSSEDVSIATATMFTELEKLGIQNLRGGITIIKAGDMQEVWGVTNLPDGRTIRSIGEFDMHLHPLWRELLKAKLNNGDYNYYRLAGKDKEDYINILNTTPSYLSQPIKDFPDVHVQSYFFGEGAIWTNSFEPHSEEQMQTMKRFASVFSLTFRRYQDLKKAEAQTREATIEAALEKVRGKAMAMHNSNDLSTTASIVFTELRKLGISPIRCGVGLLNKESRKGQIYAATSSNEEDSLSLVGWVQLSGHPVLEKIYDTWKNNEDYFPELNGEQMKTYYDLLLSGLSVSVPDTGEKQYGTFLPFSVGCLYAWSGTPYNDSELKILKRFASIIDLTFRRYIELQKSEATAKEAIKQAALDRIRADIASMRTINDLDRITPLIWNELTVLGIPFIRCGVFIMDEDHQLIHTFLSTPDGKAIAAFHLPYNTPGNLRHVVSNWKENKKYIDHWDETEFIQFADILVKGGALVSSEQYLKTIPKGGFYLHFLPFLQGMLYVGNTDQLKEEEIELIQHVSDTFSTAYARYEDFNKLEAAKQQVEKTLTDLKQAQTQLVQSEKMASLGEMTAGIAHEIQNPLNFVNNFSEVSKELLDEMKTELETGNTQDAKDIADDVIQNLEKINHHGKRADAIVKSMLQHSRSSSGKKEPADINGLADEYLRLAYHGLRAKDKSFNAKFETEFDNNIGKINIISQDIGRVLVNLINNAFYAVSERKKQESNGYEPTVTVYTKKIDDKIEIKVKDNGNGIPQKVLDKIFQPFFTTKPTGQGTGLGLSLSYDIVKAHSGEIKVNTKEREGTEFTIVLPG